MNTASNEIADATTAVEALRTDLERSRRELDECRKRMGELQQAEALLAGENRLLKMVASGCSLSDILSALCQLIEELSLGSLCGILLVDRASSRVGHVTGPSLPAEYNEAIRGAIVTPEAGPCGLAAYGKEQVIAADVSSDARWAEGWRTLALSHGLRACWSTPIFSSEGDVLGTFAIYWREPRNPSDKDQKLIDQTTHLAAVAIERQHTEDELRRSEAELHYAQRLTHTCSWKHELLTGEVIASPEVFRLYGIQPGEHVSDPRLFFGRIHPEDRQRVQDLFQKCEAEKANYEADYRIVLSDGTIRYHHSVGHPLVNETGDLVEFVGTVMDVTEQKQAQHELAAAKARFEGILEIAEDAIISVNSAQRIVLFNQGAEKVFGYAQSEVVGQPLDVLLPQRFAHAHRGHIELFAKSSDVSRTMGQRREVFGRRKDGSDFPAEASISKLDVGGELIFTVILRDITERKKSAESLRASEHLARGQLDALARTLDAMAQESDPDKLLEHALRTIVEQSDAHSASVWVRTDDGNRLDRIAVIEDGRFINVTDGSYFGPTFPSVAPHHPVWRDVIRTRQHAVLVDLERESARMCVGSGPNEIWHRVLEDVDPDPEIADLKKYLRGLGARTILFVPMLIAGEVAGIVGIRLTQRRSFRREEIELTRALAHQAMLAIQLMRLSQQSRQVAVSAERNRMARDIHDTLAQGFTGVIMQLEAAKGATTHGDVAEATNRIDRASELARSSLGEARRSVRALRPRSLSNGKLFLAIDDLFKRMTEGTGLNADFQAEGDDRSLPAEIEEGLLRITQEALTNAVKHANAKNFRATLGVGTDRIQLRLVDDGRGFDPTVDHDGFGLIGMKERVDRMGGEFIIRAKPDVGTEILVELKSQSATKSEFGNEQS